MSLRFVLGNSGSGKSGLMYRRFIKEAAAEKRSQYLVLVPEQFTMQTQREMVTMQPGHVILNIDVLSFERLAYRVFDELGENPLSVLEETGKNYIIKKLVRAHKEELKILASGVNKTGYINEIKSILSEFMQYQITPGDLEEMVEGCETSAFSLKLSDIAVLYRAYLKELDGTYLALEEVPERLARLLPKSKIAKNSTVLIDGFTGFTPVQYEVLRQLLPLCKQVYVNLTIDAKEDFYRCSGMQELFYLSKKTISQLTKLADETGCEVCPPIVFDGGDTMRYAGACDLYWLEQNLFRLHSVPYDGEQDNIAIGAFEDPAGELKYAAGMIQDMVRTKGLRYRDFAIVCPDMDTYGKYADSIFKQYGVPLFLDKKRTLLEQPFVEVVRSILEVMEHDFSYESVTRYLKTGFSGYTREEVDLLENYMLGAGIRHFSRWQRKWVRLLPGQDGEELERLEQLRQSFVAEWGALLKGFSAKNSTVEDQMRLLYEFFAAHDMEGQLLRWEQYFTKRGELTPAGEYAVVYKSVVDLMDQMVALLGKEHFTVKECREMLEAGFDSAKTGIIPPGNDCVQMGDMERSRLTSVKILFLVGMNDGLVPKMTVKGGILSEADRQTLKMHDISLAPGAREKAFIQRFYLYMIMTKPSDGLYLTYAKAGADGQPLRRSYLIRTVCRLFPSVQIITEYGDSFPEGIISPASTKDRLINGLREAVGGNVQKELPPLYQWYAASQEWSGQLKQWEDGIFYKKQADSLPEGLAKKLYGTVLYMSVTRLERFAACAFSHFLQYGLKLKERQVFEFAAVDFGNILHEALERFSGLLVERGYTWDAVPQMERTELLKQSFSDAILHVGNDSLSDSARNEYIKERMYRLFERTVWAVSHQVGDSGFTPKGYEVKFHDSASLEAANVALGGENSIRLTGKIDRIDVKEGPDSVQLQVVDYKTGAAKFDISEVYEGLQLQLLVYLDVAMEIAAGRYPDRPIKASGAYYYHIDDPILKASGEIDPQKTEDGLKKALQLKGITLEDGQYTELAEVVKKKIISLGNAVLDGETDCYPYRGNGKSGCDYCPYSGVCGFDEHLPGCDWREI